MWITSSKLSRSSALFSAVGNSSFGLCRREWLEREFERPLRLRLEVEWEPAGTVKLEAMLWHSEENKKNLNLNIYVSFKKE